MNKREKIKKLKDKIEKQIYFAQTLTNNYDKVNKLRKELEKEEKLNV